MYHAKPPFPLYRGVYQGVHFTELLTWWLRWFADNLMETWNKSNLILVCWKTSGHIMCIFPCTSVQKERAKEKVANISPCYKLWGRLWMYQQPATYFAQFYLDCFHILSFQACHVSCHQRTFLYFFAEWNNSAMQERNNSAVMSDYFRNIYSEIPLLRPPKIKTFYPLKTLFVKLKLFFSSFSIPSVPLIRDHLWDCPKVVFKTTFGQSQRWS